MEFLVWHYTAGLTWYLKRWYYLLAWVVHFFSLTLLLPTLFAPWKRMLDQEEVVGLNIQKLFEQLSYNMISRVIGAIVRSGLFIFGVMVFFPAFIIGLIGLFFWIIFPPIGLVYYSSSDQHYQRLYDRILAAVKKHPAKAVFLLFNSPPGRFILNRTGLTLDQLISVTQLEDANLSDLTINDYQSVIEYFINHKFWREDLLRSLNVNYTDLRYAAKWWDVVYARELDNETDTLKLSRPGIGLELLFGYTPNLDQISADLSLTQSFSHHLMGREALVNRIERELSGGNSIILTGLPGVGKKTVVLEFARRAMSGELGSKLIYKRVMEMDYNFLLSDALDISQKKIKLSRILDEATYAGNIILVIKDLHRLTDSQVEGLDFTDLLETHLEKRKLKIIAISSQVDYERFLAGNSRLRKYFQPVEVVPPSKEEALLIIFNSASDWEKSKRVTFSVQAINTILEGSDKYISDTPFPEKALELLDHVVVYLEKNKKYRIESDDVNIVISEQTGISLSRLTESEKKLLGDLENILHQNLIGQEIAVSLISKSLRARSIGAKDDQRPVGSFLFLGPTGVGKTQTAKSLAKVYYGSSKEILRFDMAEYAGEEGLTRLIGSVARNQPGVMTTAIKNRPASLLLLDEIEKAPRDISNLFLALLDEGKITDAFGKSITCRHLFVIATSNAGGEHIRQLVSQGVYGEQLQKQVVEFVQQQGLFSPEFLNRFDGVVVFQPLTENELVDIARLMLKDLATNLAARNIYLEITDDLCRQIAKEGFDPAFGARPMRRLVDLTLGDVLGKAVLKGDIKEGNHIKIVPADTAGDYRVVKL